MTSRPTVFKQVDVTRAVKGAVAAGLTVERVEIDQHSGKIVIFLIGNTSGQTENPCDRLLR